jgi:hypothetical protein
MPLLCAGPAGCHHADVLRMSENERIFDGTIRLQALFSVKENAMNHIAIHAQARQSASPASVFSAAWRVLTLLPVAIVAIATLPLLGVLILSGTSLRHDGYDDH